MNYTTDLLFLLLGAFFGVLSSGLFWWVQQHYWAPKLAFSPDISKIKNPYTNKGWIYRIKMKNIGKRDIIDIKLYVRIYLTYPNSTNQRVIHLPLVIDSHPQITKGRSKIIWLKTTRLHEVARKSMPGVPVKNGRNPTVEEILLFGNKAKIRLYVFGYDAFSGSRKLFKSCLYNYSDIIVGRFEKNGLAILPSPICME